MTQFFTHYRYLDSVAPTSEPALLQLQRRMFRCYAGTPYPDFVTPQAWGAESHAVHFKLCKHIPDGSRVLELGCGG